LGRVAPDGKIHLAGRRFGTIAVLFEPLPPPGLLPLLEQFVAAGGRVIWSGPPPRLDMQGKSVLQRWQQLCGVKQLQFNREGLVAAGGVVEFDGALKKVPAQTVLTDFLVDLVYPVEPDAAATVVARLAGQTLGVHRVAGRGSVTCLGFRPRDDQAASLGCESRTWFEVLRALGAYPKSRADVPAEDNPSVVSRESPYLATCFPNGTVAVAAHYRSHQEAWGGGFHRNAKADAEVIARHPLPPIELDLRGLWIAGHKVDYRGHLLMAFRADAQHRLIAFGGYACTGIGLNGRAIRFADQPLSVLAWAPIAPDQRVPGGAQMQIWVRGSGRVRIPLPPDVHGTRLVGQGLRPATPGGAVPSTIQDGVLSFEARPEWRSVLLYLL
jgi:hypothetical protein